MSVAIWLTGPLSLTGSLLEKIGQLTIPYQFNTCNVGFHRSEVDDHFFRLCVVTRCVKESEGPSKPV